MPNCKKYEHDSLHTSDACRLTGSTDLSITLKNQCQTENCNCILSDKEAMELEPESE